MATVSGVLTSDQITSLIQQASASFQAPANALQAQEKPIGAQISALGKVQGALSGLQSALAGLANIQSLAQRSVTTSPTGAVGVTATNEAAVGTYSLSNIHLAQAESLISTGFAGASGSLGAGSISIQVGSGTAQTVDIATGQDNLNSIAAAINQAVSGVTATAVFDGSAYHLALTSKTTGAASAFTVSGTGGLARFSYNPGASGLEVTETQPPANASFSLNGLAITSGSNTIKGVVPGLTLTLAASGTATVTVTQDVSALDQAANSLASALNNVLGTINQYTSYSPSSGAGPLLGDVGLQILRSNLLNAITTPAGNGIGRNQSYYSLGSVGFNITSGGTVTLDDATFQNAAQSNYAAVAALLGE